MKVLFFGDVYGEPGREFLFLHLENLKKEYKPNIIIVNGENISNNGRGISKDIYKELMKHGISAITMGNWVWSNHELLEFIDESNVIRPLNFRNAPGKGYLVINHNGKKVLVINALGRVFMNNYLDNEFFMIEELLNTIPHDYSIVDIHAEATSEKVALGMYLDGLASAVVGTHTHVQTADEKVLAKGTMYISDIGMTGPALGIIGVDSEIVVGRFLNGHSRGNMVAEGKRQINAIFMDLEKKVIKRINFYE